MKYFYARVSSSSQNLDRQVKLFKELGANDRDIFIEKKSGKDFNRPEWNELMKRIRAGDTLIVKNFDRIGRNSKEVRQILLALSEKNVLIESLEQAYLNDYINKTLQNKAADDLAGAILDVMLETMLQVDLLRAEWERKTLKKRQAEGIKRAKEKGKKFGRKINTDYIEKFNLYYTLTRDKDSENYITVKKAIELIGCSYPQFYNLAKKYNKEEK